MAAWFFNDLEPMLFARSAVDGDWHHAAYTYDGTLHRLYYEGMEVDSEMRAPRRATITNPRLGTWQSPDEMFQGSIDDLRIYSRSLSADEILTLAAGQ